MKRLNAELVQKHIDLFRCVICQASFKVKESRSLVCINNHTFDFARQGYVNLLLKKVESHYDKSLFRSRRSIITESKLYAKLHETISNIINKTFINLEKVVIYDAGCGEGSHLHEIIQQSKLNTIGVGVDISKEGIQLASSGYKESIWFVADLARSPLVDESCDAILNILSPANYDDFKRLLRDEGIMIKVVPRSNYLKELREALYEDSTYDNEDIVSLFKEQFQLLKHLPLTYQVKLNEEDLENLLKMSPLAWNARIEALNTFINEGPRSITVDLDMLIGKK